MAKNEPNAPLFTFKWPWQGRKDDLHKHPAHFDLFHIFQNQPSHFLTAVSYENDASAAHQAEFVICTSNALVKSPNGRTRARGLNFSSPIALRSSLFDFMRKDQKVASPIDSIGSAFQCWVRNVKSINRRNIFQALENLNILNVVGNKLADLTRERASMPLLASISSSVSHASVAEASEPPKLKRMTVAQISKRLDGVPVYAVSNYSNEFVLVSDINASKSLGIFCFRQEDAEALLAQVKDREPSLGRGARVVSVSLDKVYQLNAEGIAFRFLPDPRQVKHALQETMKSSDSGKGFDGVPVFLSDNLILKIKSQRLCPIFFSKEDLESALQKAISQQQKTNPNLRVKNEIQVGSFEDVLKKMENNDEESEWGNIVFIPLGMDAKNFLERSTSASRGN